ncbi:hypothetical protein SGCOL_011592 [Colletotrichum sp. CLE4]
MSAGPGPPKSPAPHPPRRGQSVTAGRLTRYRSVREHKSVLDFGRNWRDWEVDIFQDDETVSNATTETGTATSIALGLGIGIAVDEEEESGVAGDDGQTSVSSPHPQYQYQHQQQQQQQQTPASSARRRRTAPLLSTPPPQTPSGAPQLTMQWQWPDLMADTGVSDGSSPFDFDNSSYLLHHHCPWSQQFQSSAHSHLRLHLLLRQRQEKDSKERHHLNQLHHRRQYRITLLLLLLPLHHHTRYYIEHNHLLLDWDWDWDCFRCPSRLKAKPESKPRHIIPEHATSSRLPVSICALLAARAEHARSQIITKLALQPDLDNNYYTSNNTNKEELHSSNDPNWDQQLARQEEDRQRRRHQQHHQQLLAQEEEEHRRRKEQEEEDAARWAEEVARLEAETDRILADQKAKDLARLSAQLADQKAKDLARLQAQLAAVPDAPASRVRSPIVDKFTFFLRKGRKSDPATTLTKPPSQYFQPLTLDHRPVSVMDPSRFIQAGGGGIVPQTDAPTSASNAGERRVTIRCMQSSISLPVTPDTTPSEILYSAANLMTHNINPQTSVVLECYFAFGLERRLRRYEPVALVMNSWDRDTQHCLLIVPGEPTDKNPDLNIESVPRTIDPPPGLINFALYHSQRPGKWNKRYVTLLETGQMFSAKKKDAKLSDKDAVSLCHLSDFDLYTVTEKDMLKQIRAPKKNCFAIKSQQKSTVFQNTENFIHFFATDDVKLAEDFQRVVQGWRSWYIANKIVDLNKKKSSTHSSSARSGTKTGGGGLTRSGTLHRPRPSTEETPYTIGTFSPLLDMDRFEKSIDDFGKDLDNKPTARPADHHSTPRHIQSQKVVSRSRTTPNLSQPQTRRLIDPFAKDEFKSGGLLGQAYEGRKQQAEKAAATADHQQYAVDSPFTGGHSLLGQFPEHENNGMPQRRGTVRSSRPTATDPMPQPRSRSRPPAGRPTTSSRPKTSDGGSSSGKREMPQPLVDLTPKVPDLPAAWRDGQGRGVRVPTGKPLIEMATGLELPDGHLGPQLPTVTRMGTAKAYPPQRMASQSAASRPRSRSTAGGGAVRRVVSNEQQPPMPSMPRRSSRRDDDDVPLINFVERERGRDTRPRMSQGMSQGLGRSGTVRH